MERAVFAERFREASARARDFSRMFIEEPLPDTILFRARLNGSHDGNPLHEDERVFPEDGAAELARRLSCCTSDEVLDVLWRDGLVPEWVNLTVIGKTGTATLIEVLSCGRFTANERLLYHQREGRPPFHVLGPSLPVGFEAGQKFSVYHNSECWNRDELRLVAPHTAKVWSLDLHGEDFDDEVIASLPVFERMHILELKGSKLNGRGLAGLNRQPTLHHLRLYLNHQGPFVAHLPNLRPLQTLTIEGLPPGAWGFPAVAAQTGLEELSLSTAHNLVLDARLPGALKSLMLRARSVEGDPIPENVARLRLHLREARDADIERLLARVKAATHLTLRGTPISEHLIESIVSRWKLEYLDVVDTLVDHECVRRIRARYPELRTAPNPEVRQPQRKSDS